MVLILVLITVCIFLAIELFSRKSKKDREKKRLTPDISSVDIHRSLLRLIKKEDFMLPEGFFYSSKHVWAKILPQGDLMLGIDCFPARLLGKIDKIKLNKPGECVNEKGRMCILRKGRKKLYFSSPLEGTIKAVNQELLEAPTIIVDDPYEKGWMYVVRPSLQCTHFKDREGGDANIQNWMQREAQHVADFIYDEYSSKKKFINSIQAARFSFQGILKSMDYYAWKKFQNRLLR